MRDCERGPRAVETSISVSKQGKAMGANEKPNAQAKHDGRAHNRSGRAMLLRFDRLNQAHNLTALGTTTSDLRVRSRLL